MGIYPNWTAGKRITADSLAAGQLLIAYKTASTDRSSTTTLTADPDLKLTLAANATYWIEWILHYAGPTNASPHGTIAVQWSVPSGATGQRAVRGAGSGASDSSVDEVLMVAAAGVAFTSTIEYGARTSSSTNQAVAREEGLVMTTAAGVCAVSWAQAVSSTTANRMAAGSWGRALRIA